MTAIRKNKLSVVIIARDEEKNIARCLDSVLWADEIVVLDSGSADKTPSICREKGCRVIVTEWLGFGPTKQRAVASATHNWILAIDADEQVSPELQKAIRALLDGEPSHKGYRIKRNTFYVDRWIRHSGWNKDYPLRLFDRRYGNYNDNRVHESVQLNKTPGRIHAPLLHYSYPDLASYQKKSALYARLGAGQLFAGGKRCGVTAAFVHGAATFIKMYLLKAGFLDGKTGLVLSANAAFGIYMKYLLLWEMTLRESRQA